MLISKLFLSWMKKNATPRRLTTNRRQRISMVPVERLEERTVLTTVFVVNDAGTQLSRFDSENPTVALAPAVTITGLLAATQIEGIDFRPATGQLYALGIVNAGAAANDSQGSIYTINTTTGVAKRVGSTAFKTDLLDNASYGFDFNPRADRIRIVSDADLNLRVNPNDGALFLVDTGLAFDAGDSNVGDDPAVVAAAYDQNVSSSTVTTLFGIDFSNKALVRQGGENGPPSPNEGPLTTIGTTLGVVPTSTSIGFDILDGTATGFASMTVGGTTGFYSINLGTGVATSVGNLLTGSAPMPDLAIQPAAAPVFVGTTIVLTGTANADTVVVTATGPNSGTYQIGNAPAVSFSGITAFTFNGGTDNDTLTIYNPAGGLFAPTGGIVFDGGGQIEETDTPGDSLQILDGAHTRETHTFGVAGENGKSGTIALVNGATTANYSYSNLEPVLVNAGTPATVVFNLASGNGNDQAELRDDDGVGNNISRLQSVAGKFEATDFVTPTTSLTINLGNDGENYSQQAVDTAFNTPNIAVKGGTGANIFFLFATPTGVTTTITGGAVQDDVGIGTGANSLDTILGAVVFNDVAGVATDRLSIFDQGDLNPNNYIFNVASGKGAIARTGAALITYNSLVNFVEVNGGTMANIYDVLATPTGVTTTITGGALQDTVNIGSAANSLDTILGPVVFNDDAGANANDTLKILDQGDADANNYTINGTTIDRDGTGAGTSITYNANVDRLILSTGLGANRIEVAATGIATPGGSAGGSDGLIVNAGAGNDLINVNGPNLTSGHIYIFNGEGDNDVFNVTPASNAGGIKDIKINGGSPTAPAITGDSLSVNQTGVTGGMLNLPALPSGDGTYTSSSHQMVAFTEIETFGTTLMLPNTANAVTVLCVGTDVVVRLNGIVIFTGAAASFFGDLTIEGGSKTDRITLDSSLNGCFPMTSKLIVNGNDGNDTVNASRLNLDITIRGGAGNDILTGGDGDDSMEGGSGNDGVKSGDGNDNVKGDSGNDALDASSGNDLVLGGDGNDNIIGGGGNDLLFGEAGNDVFSGGSGNDVQVGGAGNDKLNGGSGRSVLIGGVGRDIITGGSGDDILIAGSTNFDDPTVPANLTALTNIMAEWGKVATYETRTMNLRNGGDGSLNGTAVLTPTTVHNDTDNDVLKGRDGRDWFFARPVLNVQDQMSDRVPLLEALDLI